MIDNLARRCLWLVRVCVPVLLLLAASPQVRSQPANIVYSTTIESGDTKLFVELRGPARKAPILLYLHGGPGNVLGLVSFRAYVGPQLESRFLVAYLHQRGVLNSPAVPDSSQTIANHVADVEHVVRYLRRRFPHRRLFILGHSWGGTLAMLSVLDRPDLADGVIDVAGPFSTQGDLRASYGAAMRWAQTNHVAEGVAELKSLGPPPYRDLDQQITLSKWASQANGGIDANVLDAKLLSRAPYTRMEAQWEQVYLHIARAMYSDLGELNIEGQLPRLHIPLLVIIGSRDAVVPPDCMRAGYLAYGGKKSWVELIRSHHLPFVDEPLRFVQAVENFTQRRR